jgi:hypothetical protein
MNYDAAVLEFVSMSEGGVFPVVAATDTRTPGVIRVARAIADADVSGDKPIVTISFKVIGTTGSGAIGFDKAYSYLVRSSDNKDILQNVGSGSVAIGPSPGSATPVATAPATNSSKPTFYINPPTGSFAPGSTITAAVRINTHSVAVTTVEAAISYPANQLQYNGVSEGGPFVTKQRTSAGNGTINVIRSIPGGSEPVQGDESVVTISFKVIGRSGDATLKFDASSAAYDASGTGTNILDQASSGIGKYTISSTAPATSASTEPAVPTTVVSPAQAVSITSKGTSGRAAITSDSSGATITELSGEVTLAPIIDPTVTTPGSKETVKKVEYFLGEELIVSKSSQPFSFTFDSKSKQNGTYTLVVKTYYSSGRVDSRTDTLLIKNKVDATYVARNYGSYVLVTAITLGLLAFVIVKLVIPRAARRHSATPTKDPDALYGFSQQPNTFNGGPVASDPTVVAPTGSLAAPTAVAGMSSAMMTPALPMNNTNDINTTNPVVAELLAPTMQASQALAAPLNPTPSPQSPSAPIAPPVSSSSTGAISPVTNSIVTPSATPQASGLPLSSAVRYVDGIRPPAATSSPVRPAPADAQTPSPMPAPVQPSSSSISPVSATSSMPLTPYSPATASVQPIVSISPAVPLTNSVSPVLNSPVSTSSQPLPTPPSTPTPPTYAPSATV